MLIVKAVSFLRGEPGTAHVSVQFFKEKTWSFPVFFFEKNSTGEVVAPRSTS